MRELDADSAADYLVATGRLAEPVPVRPLGWGVSNVVLWVEAPGRPFVLKQSRSRLRTREPWFSSLERVYREADAMRALRPVLGDVVPEVLFEDRENCLFAMTAAPAEAVVWKQQLLAGVAESAIARKTAGILATVHQHGAQCDQWRTRFADQRNFYELRLEPYYLRLRDRVSELAGDLDRLVADSTAVRTTLVHGDFSPKNMLLHASGLVLVDYETVHFGDPAFDLGFFLAHLTLKTIYHAGRHAPFADLIGEFWKTYLSAVHREPAPALIARGLRHLAANLLVRIDGTSPVEYLTNPAHRQAGREYAHRLFAARLDSWGTALEWLERTIPRSS